MVQPKKDKKRPPPHQKKKKKKKIPKQPPGPESCMLPLYTTCPRITCIIYTYYRIRIYTRPQNHLESLYMQILSPYTSFLSQNPWEGSTL